MKVFVVKKDPNLTAEDVIKFCGTQLTGYKVPKQIEFRDRTAEDQCRQDPAPRAARREKSSVDAAECLRAAPLAIGGGIHNTAQNKASRPT